MRLHMVKLRAFGPYAAEQVIDFGRLAGSGLFLLEGPTGAGKTTILDAVTFALYGGLSGEGSGSDRLHSGFAGPDVEPSVTVEFSLRGVRYRITRVPEHQRPKKRGEGYTTQPMRVHLERRDSAGWTSLTSNKAEAGVMVTEAVGLNRAQFTQVMLLPQGEFARFLRCGDDDRRALLTKLFGTELYDRITAQLDNGRADALRERRESAARIENALAAAAEAAGLGQAERTGLLALPGPDRAVGLKDIAAELAAAMTTGEKKLTAAGDRLAAARASDAQAQQRAERMARLTGVLAKLREHESTRADQDRRAARLAAARQAEPVRPLLAAASEAEAAARVARAGLLRLVPAPDESMLAGLGGREAAARAEADAQEAAGLQHLVDEETGLADQEEMLAGLDEAAQQAAARVSALTAARSELPDRIRRLEEECAAARAAAAGADGARARLDTVAKQLAAARQLQELEPEAAAALADLQAAVDRHQALVDEHQALADARLSGIAAELAGRLSGGEPCPVCGSCTHPAPACADAGAVAAEDVEAARQQRDDAAAERERLEREHAVLAREVAGCAAVADGKSAGELSAEADRLSAAVAAAEQAAAQAAELAAAASAAREEQGAVDGQTLAAEKELAARSGRLTTARDGLARLRS
ncbi:MAG: AAA family ATPase, partial [Actinobacteria bacterium]|nr:AAA family ATPase [Actinomycetota bacterium]